MNATPPSISIIIPVLNEEAHIAILLVYIQKHTTPKLVKEVILVDGGSTDNTIAIASTYKATIVSSPRGRAVQMNTGARIATGTILYFLHADTLPPTQFDLIITKAYNEGNFAGCFQLLFNNSSGFLRIFSWFTRFNFLICRGGDQSLYVCKKLFQEIGAFNEDYQVYEDVEIIERIQKKQRFTVLSSQVTTSTRRYEERGLLALQWHFAIIHLKYFLGTSPNELHRYYKKHVLKQT